MVTPSEGALFSLLSTQEATIGRSIGPVQNVSGQSSCRQWRQCSGRSHWHVGAVSTSSISYSEVAPWLSAFRTYSSNSCAAGNFPLHGRAEIVDVELRDLLRILSGLDVDVPELHRHTRLLPLGLPEARRGGACRSQLGSTSRGTQPAFARFPALSGAGFQPYRCWVTASTNAGLPFLICATAR